MSLRALRGLLAVGAFALAVGASGPVVAAGPLVTPSAPVADRLVPDRPAAPPDPGAEPASAGEPAPAGEPARPVPAAPLPAPTAATPDGAGGAASGTAATSGRPVRDAVLVALSVLAALVGAVSLHERLSPPRARRLREPPAWTAAEGAAMITGPGTVSPAGVPVPAVQPAGAAVVPVLARPAGAAATWTELHDLVDTWAWHEYWLPTGRAGGAVLPADGLVLGDAVALDRAAVTWGPGLVAPFPGCDPVVLPVSAGVILSRPAAADVASLRTWLSREVRALRAASRQRAGAAVALGHALTGPAWAVGLPAAAAVTGAGPWVAALTLAPLGVGVVTAVLRWAALDDVDRSTTLRLPVRRGAWLIVTGPVHALLRMREAWAALASAPPVPMSRRVALAVGRRPGVRPPGPRPAPWSSAGRA